jgi:enterobactin synthetase component D / holo-[acyl-carrier protein] synthase
VGPARLSAALAALFPAGAVRGAELRYATAAGSDAAQVSARRPMQARALLTLPEWQAIRHCRPVRIRDFTAGRLCARRALLQLGIRDFSLLAASDRRPLWPAGVVGSITHTQGYSAAVVARCEAIASLGIDTERVSAVHPRLWPLFCTSAEIEWLWRLAARERARAAALIFAAKEAYFKCQYALVREPLGFDAIELEAPGVDELAVLAPGSVSFRMRLQKGRLSAQLAQAPARAGRLAQASRPVRLEGRYRLHGPFITVAVALPASALGQRARPEPDPAHVRRRAS